MQKFSSTATSLASARAASASATTSALQPVLSPLRPPSLLFRSVLLAGLLGGCAGLPSTEQATVDGRTVELAAIRRWPPVVVFEHGLGSDMTTWKSVIREIAKDATVFAYNRPGAGGTEAVATRRDGAHIVGELRTLLRNRNLEPPYVLVGHSLGGLYMQLFARRHPEEVAGLVLVDSTHPTQFEGPNTLDQSLVSRALRWFILSSSDRDELAESMNTGQDVLRSPPLDSTPIAILSADTAAWSERGRFAKDKQADLGRLYRGSHQTWVDSGHFIQEEEPEAVIQAVHWVIDQRFGAAE